MDFCYDRPYFYIHTDTDNPANIIFFIIYAGVLYSLDHIDDSDIAEGTLNIYVNTTVPSPAPTFFTTQTISFPYDPDQIVTVNTYLMTAISTIPIHCSDQEAR